LKIWFVVGVSGAGKSHFSEYAAGHLGFFHYEIDQTQVTFIVLTGDAELCKREFLKREQQTGRNYSASVWEAHNRPLYKVMDQPWLSDYLMPVFKKDGQRKTVQELVDVLSEVI
jgi:2-phosphoglycerate kinase